MLKLQIIDREIFYYVYTNDGNILILVTRSNRFATITNAALKNTKNDANYRVTAYKEKKKKKAA
jgi:hypothetical protein